MYIKQFLRSRKQYTLNHKIKKINVLYFFTLDEQLHFNMFDHICVYIVVKLLKREWQ